MDGLRIRSFIYPDDYQAVLTFWEQAGKGIHVGFSDQAEEIERKLTRDPDLFLVAELHGMLAGTVIGGYDGRRGLIYHLAVRRDLRKQGLGRELLAEVENRLIRKGCYKCYLLVAEDNLSAMDFYKNRGWSEVQNVRLFGKTLR